MIYTFLSCLSTQFVHDIIHESLSTHVFTNILLLRDQRDPIDLIKRGWMERQMTTENL